MLVEVGGLDLEVFRTEGDETLAPIVLLHEGLGAAGAWGDFPQLLRAATGRSIVAYSRAGYGRSTVVREPFDVAYMHREADAVLPVLLDRLEIPHAVLFGHSDGGSIALIFAAHEPERVDALILEAPHVFVEDLTVESIAEISRRYPDDARLRRGLARYHEDPDLAFKRWNEIWLSPPFRQWNITDLLRGIRAPALVLQGRDDEYGTLAQVDAITKALPQAETALLDGCGHAPHRDAREQVLALTASFVRRAPARTVAQ
ncbi:MAG: alpha/beta fold hydrolase [Vulcanimicrobiaceae bacterium]